MSHPISVVTEITDSAGTSRITYTGVLIGKDHAFYIDPEWNVAVVERVSPRGGEYITTGGSGSVILEISGVSTSLLDELPGMSAIDLLARFSNPSGGVLK